MSAACELPTDTETLHKLVRELQSRLVISEARCATLEYKLQDVLRRVYGPKSEHLDPAQRVLFGILENAGIATLPAATASASGKSSSARAPRKGGGRRPKPENLPVRREVIDLPEAQKAGLVKIREEITEQIEYQPSQIGGPVS
jgi:hypothetical protein